METIGERIRQRRTLLNITQDELGETVGVAGATITRYEKGQIKTLKQEMISKIANALKCNPNWLMGWADTPNICSDVKQEANSSDTQNEKIDLSSIEKEFIIKYRNSLGVDKIDEAQRTDVLLDIQLLEFFHKLNKDGQESVITNAGGCCLNSKYVKEKVEEILA